MRILPALEVLRDSFLTWIPIPSSAGDDLRDKTSMAFSAAAIEGAATANKVEPGGSE
jgi:hypothetical protein